MKKFNKSNASAMVALGFTLVVVAAGFGTNSVNADFQLMSTPTTKATKTGSSDSGAGNGTTKSAPTTNAKTGSSDSGAGNGTTKSTTTTKTGSSDSGTGNGTTKSTTKTGSSDSGTGNGTTKSAPTTIAKTGSADGGTGKSVTVSDSELSKSIKMDAYTDTVSVTLTKVQMNALTTAQWETVDGYLQASQVASIPTKTIKNLSTTALIGLSSNGTKALTTAQLKVMSKDQLNALVSSGELTDTQLETVNKKLKQLG